MAGYDETEYDEASEVEEVSEVEEFPLEDEPISVKCAPRAVAKPAPKVVNPLTEPFLDEEIRVVRTLEEPLFRMIDVTKIVREPNADLMHRAYEAEANKTKNPENACAVMLIEDQPGTPRGLYLTENGLNRYLLRSPLNGAMELQVRLFNIIKRVRLHDTSKRLLAAQIEIARAKAVRELLEISRLEKELALRECRDAVSELEALKKRILAARVAKAQSTTRTR